MDDTPVPTWLQAFGGLLAAVLGLGEWLRRSLKSMVSNALELERTKRENLSAVYESGHKALSDRVDRLDNKHDGLTEQVIRIDERQKSIIRQTTKNPEEPPQ